MDGLFNREVRILIRKELRQVTRSRAALASSVLLPVLLLLVVPMIQLTAIHFANGAKATPAPIRGLPPGLSSVSPDELYTTFLFPLLVTLGGIVVPTVAVTYSIVTERERKSLELLIALPVRVRDILVAKIAAVLMLAAALVVPLFAIDAVVLLTLGVAGPGTILLLLLVLLSALACSAGTALVLTLVARDYRAANNLNGAMMVPLLFITGAVLIGVPSPWKLLVLAGVLVLLGAAALTASVRWLTFERYLS